MREEPASQSIEPGAATPPGARSTLIGAAVVFALAFVGFHATRALGFTPEGAPWAFWMPNALALAVFVRAPRSAWPWLAFAMVSAELTAGATMGFRLNPLAVIAACANAAEVAIATYCLHYTVGRQPTLSGLSAATWFFLSACAIAPVTSAFVVTAAGVVLGELDAPLRFFRDFCVGDAVGMIVLGPLVLLDRRAIAGHAPRVAWIEALCLVTVLAGVTAYVFGRPPPHDLALLLPYVFFPVLTWGGLRMGPAGAALLGAAFALATVAFTARGLGPFALAGTTVSERVVSLQLFLGIALTANLALAVVTDERRRTARALAQQTSLLRGLVEGTPDVVVVKRPNGAPVLLNRAALVLLGPSDSPERGLSRDSKELIDAHDRAVLRERRAETFEEEITVGGRRLTYLSTRFPVFIDSDEPSLIVAICREITERKALQTHLHQSQKMEAVGRLAGGVAHDFNNLLTAIVVSAGLLRSRFDETGMEGAEEHEALDVIEQTAQRAAELTRRLLTFSRRDLPSPQPLELVRRTNDMRKILARLLGSEVALVAEARERDLWLRLDDGQLEQIVFNLAINARDAMPAGGTVRLICGRETDDAGKSWVWLEVIDDGEGMDEATLGRIFEPFFTTKGPGKGTGLGLAVVYGIVQEAAGTIDAESTPGVGTRFRLRFPAIEAHEIEDTPAAETPERGSEHILLVEDEQMVRTLCSRILTQAGYRVTAAANGADALRLEFPIDDVPDLLLTDLRMPHMRGDALAAIARERWPRIAVVWMSSNQGEISSNIDAPFVAKPFRREELLSTIRAALDAQVAAAQA